MKFVDEYRDAEGARKLSAAIHKLVTRPHTIMEVCGGQTHAIVKFGLDELLPESVNIVHGPGCPVCVTPIELIDYALHIAGQPGVIFCSFGDMLRVPGSSEDLLSVRARGADVRMLYSPLDALEIARKNPDREVVFFAVGFETTAPTTAAAVARAAMEGLTNFSLLVSHVLVPPAIEAVLSSEHNLVQGFLAAGHVCAVMGWKEYEPLAEKYHVPIVVTGFEPLDILQGTYMCLKQLEEGRGEVENQYARAVKREGNVAAMQVMEDVFEVSRRAWRGIGEIPESGLVLRDKYSGFDALKRFSLPETCSKESSDCISGLVLQGLRKPHECPMFGRVCNPEHPLGATMVSSEGACAAYYRYRGIRAQLEEDRP